MTEHSSRSMSEDAVTFFDCPKCEAPRGTECEVSVVFGGLRITHKARSEVLAYWQHNGTQARKDIRKDRKKFRGMPHNAKGPEL